MQKSTRVSISIISTAAVLSLFGCSHRKVDADTQPPTVDPKDQKIENLTAALSRAQSRIEELDAKVSALSDKVEATRISVDNISGNRPLNTEAVGSATAEDAPADQPAATRAKRASLVDETSAPEIIGKDEGATGEFARAMRIFRAGKYSDAELAFNHFTERYPEHVLAGSAQYYAGESYFQMNQYKLALTEFGKVVQSFSTSPRVATALVRMSQCYEADGNYGEAKRTLALARDVYDGNPSLDLAVAGFKKTAGADKAELNAAPMEPSAKKRDDENQK